MRTVLTGDMVAHVWAQQKQSEGRSGNGNFYFTGRTLYSYGSHFPVGIFVAPGGPVFLNADSYSMSTNRHQSHAWSATRHLERFNVPALGALAYLLEGAARHGGRFPESDRPAALAYLRAHWAKLSPDNPGAQWILRAAGSRGTWAAMRSRLASDAAKAKDKEQAGLKRLAVKEGREIAARHWPEYRDSNLQSLGDTRGIISLRNTVKDIRAARLATPKAHKRVRAILWTYESRLRVSLARAERDSDRWGNAGDRTKARGYLATLRRLKAGRIGYVPGFDGPDGPEKRAAAFDLPTGAAWRLLSDRLRDLLALPVHIPAAMRAAADILRAKADRIATEREGEETQRREKRDALNRSLAALKTFNATRRRYRAALVSGAWQDSERFPVRTKANLLTALSRDIPDAQPWGTVRGYELRPALAERMARVASRAADIAAALEPERVTYLEQWERDELDRKAAERAERERLAAMSQEERRAAYMSGELTRAQLSGYNSGYTGPVLLRAIAPEIDGCTVTGGTLETSQGATVPLRHAFRVFQFVAACRAAGKAWRPLAEHFGALHPYRHGPKTIRVGHFTVDRIDSTGDFIAGCHAIKWPEIAALAESLGVSGCLAELETISGELESAA